MHAPVNAPGDRLETLDASRLAPLIADGAISSEDLVRACLARIALREPQVRAWAHVATDATIAKAREADKVRAAKPGTGGLLDGIPLGFKDVIATANMPTQYNSSQYEGFQPTADASAVALMRTAGAIVLGKNETVEFAAHGRNPLTRNPHDLARTPGGSSSGSAAAVADHMVPIAFGTQTGGSLIRPASYCGVYGFKPTHGVVSSEGMKAFAPTLDTIGWYARSLDDISRVGRVFGLCEEIAVAPRKPRIGFYRTTYWDRMEPGAQRAIEAAAEQLSSCADVVAFDPGPEFYDLDALKLTIMQGEGWANFLDIYRRFGDAASAGIRKRMHAPDRKALVAAIDEAARLRPLFEARLGDIDIIMTPAAASEALLGISDTGSPIFNSLWTLLHMPCLSMPVLRGPSGLPLGLQLVAPRYGDAALFDIAAQLLPAFDS